MSVWTYTEQVSPRMEPLADCWSWGLNCDRSANPWLVFLDLIGYFSEEYGDGISLGGAGHVGNLGYVELGKLADALICYADYPNDVREWVKGLIEADTE